MSEFKIDVCIIGKGGSMGSIVFNNSCENLIWSNSLGDSLCSDDKIIDRVKEMLKNTDLGFTTGLYESTFSFHMETATKEMDAHGYSIFSKDKLLRIIGKLVLEI